MTATVEGLQQGAEAWLPPAPRASAESYTAPLEVAAYGDYRVLCDYENDCFRHIGAQGPEAYSRAVQDPRTVFLPIDGRLYPALVPVGYEKMYAEERCKKLTGKEEVMLLSLPLGRVYQGDLAGGKLVGGEGLPEDYAIIVEEQRPQSSEHDREIDHALVASCMSGFGTLQPKEFVNESLAAKPDHRTAWMAIYGFSIDPASTEGVNYPTLTAEERFEKVYAEYREAKGIPPRPTDDSNETYLFKAQELRENPDIVEELWRISERGFGKVLGESHPVSMEFNREFFDRQLMTDGIYTAVRYLDGRPVCFGSMAQNMDHNDWLDRTSSVLQSELSAAASKGRQIAHFFELISDGSGISVSPDILHLYLDLVGRTGIPYKVFFESTNFSSLYIPKIVSRGVDSSPGVQMAEPVKKIATLDYWYLTRDSPRTE